MTGRKTFEVGKMLFKANTFLANSKPEQFNERIATFNFMSSILHATNNYKGFGYLQMVMKPEGGVFSLGDESRRCMYVSNALVDDYNSAKETWEASK